MEKVRDFLHKISQIEYKLFFFAAYVGFLIYLFIETRSWLNVLYVHIVAVFLFSIYYFGLQFLYISVAPLFAVTLPFFNFVSYRYLKKYKRNTPAEVAIILAHSNWFKLEAWIKPNYLVSELKKLVAYFQARKQDFSFYTGANIKDVEKIMADKNIKEVCFVGHGTSHVFQLCTDDILYYCDFNDVRYGKEFVHQIHCGTTDGKSLVDYVVREENKNGCFLIRKSINSFDIDKEFDRKIKGLATEV